MKAHCWLDVLSTVAVLAVSLSSHGTTLLEGKGIRLAFDVADKGFNCLFVENRANPIPVSFGGEMQGKAAFWSLTFWRDGSPTNSLTIDNLAPCTKSVRREDGELVFDWCGLSLGDEQGVVDVKATVTLVQNETAAEWRLAVRNRSARWGLAGTAYPIIRNVVRPGKADVLFPRGNQGGRLVRGYKEGAALRYPHVWGTQVQTCAFMIGGSGLQITALDGKSQDKVFDMTGLDFMLRYRCPDEGVSGSANAPDFAVETAAFSGDWWRAAKRYRAWATRQKWAAKGSLATRKDFNRQLGDVGFWMRNNMVEPPLISNMMVRAMAALPDIPLGLHWYNWQTCPFDQYYPDIFPARQGVKETVAWLKGKGVLVMPYINGRLWDNGMASFTNAIPFACKKPEGTCYEEEYTPGRKFAPMCPTVKPWQDVINSLCDRVEDELGVNAIYIDQISASASAPCHDKTHGHQLGGGAYWTDGYRELMTPIREKAALRGVALTSESAIESYMDSFDAYLTWFGHAIDEVPLLAAVYSGYAVYFGSVEDDEGKDTIDAYCIQQGREFLWGVQLGWNVRWILDEAHKEHLVFTARLCRERIAHKEFFVYGELLGELPISADVPTVEVSFVRKGYLGDNGPFRLPVVRGAVWRDVAGNRRVFIVNMSGSPQPFTYDDGVNRKTVMLPPRGVVSEALR